MSKFKLGDVVEAFGLRGEVVEINIRGNREYPLKVTFTNGNYESFTYDGRQYKWHRDPSLKLIDRPKKKKKVFKEWINIFGYIQGILIDDDYISPKGKCYEDGFLMWTGREFEIEVGDND